MKLVPISRRRFALLAGVAASVAGAESMTAEVILRRIQEELGGEWAAGGPDGFQSGDPSTQAKGIATTAMATLDVLKQALEAKTNLVLTYEPAFHARGDDPVIKAKREFIEKNGLVVFRLRDHWQARKENEMVTGLAGALGWSRRVKNDDALYDIPPATAEATVALIRSKLNLRGGLRSVGDRKAVVRCVLLAPGSMSPAVMWRRYSEVDMVIAGEVREWENTHYAADMFIAGEKRALVTTGRVVSEEPGMRLCAQWVKTIVMEVPARWIGVGDPYWRSV
jgi:hypothetical protein